MVLYTIGTLSTDGDDSRTHMSRTADKIKHEDRIEQITAWFPDHIIEVDTEISELCQECDEYDRDHMISELNECKSLLDFMEC